MNQPHWRQLSKCKGMDGDLFFPSVGGSTREAKRICNGTKDSSPCPVKSECLAFAMSTERSDGDRFGVYGGLSGLQRRQMFGRYPAQRPKKKCANGHEYTEENTYIVGNGQRRCKTCRDTAPDWCKNNHPYDMMRDSAGTKRCRTCYRKGQRASDEKFRSARRKSA